MTNLPMADLEMAAVWATIAMIVSAVGLTFMLLNKKAQEKKDKDKDQLPR